MRNLKKFLALVLAMVMAFSLMLSANAAYGDYDKYADKDKITEGFEEAVSVLTGLDVFKGDEHGFRPDSTLTRAEAAAVVYRVATGDVKDVQTPLYADYNHFSDVNKSDWFAGYVGFCQNAGYIKGTSPTTFNPYGQVSGYELLAMLLRVVGYGQNNEFTGSTWQVKVAALAEQLHITDSVKEANFTSTLNMNARRDVVAELTFVTMTTVPTVTYTPAMSYSDRVVLTATPKNPTLGQKIFGLFSTEDYYGELTGKQDYADTIDQWGRPGYFWVEKGTDTGSVDTSTQLPIYWTGNEATRKAHIVAAIAYPVSASFTKRVTECDIAESVGMTVSSRGIEGAYIDGEAYSIFDEATTTAKDGTIGLYETSSYVGGNGRILEVYEMPTDPVSYRLVEINTYLAKVTGVTDGGYDANNHEYAGYSTYEVYVKSDARYDSLKTDSTQVFDNTKTTFWGALRDNNGDATVNTLTAYLDDTSFSVGDYVLVTASQTSYGSTTSIPTSNGGRVTNLLEEVKAAKIVSGGMITNYTIGSGATPGTTTVGNGTAATTYKDADKFVLNRRTLTDQPLSVALDEYDNIIGRVGTSQYLVIEKIEWKHSTETIGNGYALADVVLANGTKQSSVKVSYVNNDAVTNVGDQAGRPGRIDTDSNNVIVLTSGEQYAGTVSDYYQNNMAYYHHVFTYSVNSDGTYSLTTPTDITTGYAKHDSGIILDTQAAPGLTWPDPGVVNITRGQATIDVVSTYVNNINQFVATDNTVFMVLNSDGYSYTTYTGKNNVPTMHNVNACILLNSSNYAQLVVVKSNQAQANTFMAFVPNQAQFLEIGAVGSQTHAYNVYPVGESSSRTVYDLDITSRPLTGAVTTWGAGFYEITVDNNNNVTAVANSGAPYMSDNLALEFVQNNLDQADASGMNGVSVTSSSTTANLLKGTLKAAQSGNSFQVADFSGTQVVDFNVTSDTKILTLSANDLWNSSPAPVVSVASNSGALSSTANQGKTIIVEFESIGSNSSTRYQAKTVYVVITTPTAVAKATEVATNWDLYKGTYNIANNIKVWAPDTVNVPTATNNDALAAAKANVRTISARLVNDNGNLSLYDAYGTLQYQLVRVFTSFSQIPSTATSLTASNTYNRNLEAGNYVLIETLDTSSNYGAVVYQIVD